MATGTGKRPGRAVRAVVKLLDRMGYRYVLLPFSAPRTCNICGFEGTFLPSGVHSVRPDVICPSCRSKGRHRLFALFLERSGWTAEGKDVLHFAPSGRSPPCSGRARAAMWART
jgi:predicted Zn-ribbon and HTH transcriptional regulator